MSDGVGGEVEGLSVSEVVAVGGEPFVGATPPDVVQGEDQRGAGVGLGRRAQGGEVVAGVDAVGAQVADPREVMALGESPQGRSSNFPTLGGCHCSGRRVPVAA